jgi:ferritin
MEAAITYMRVSSWFDAQNLTGIAGLMKRESHDEMEHAWSIVDYINKRNGEANIPTVGPKEFELADYHEIFKSILGLEQDTE